MRRHSRRSSTVAATGHGDGGTPRTDRVRKLASPYLKPGRQLVEHVVDEALHPKEKGLPSRHFHRWCRVRHIRPPALINRQRSGYKLGGLLFLCPIFFTDFRRGRGLESLRWRGGTLRTRWRTPSRGDTREHPGWAHGCMETLEASRSSHRRSAKEFSPRGSVPFPSANRLHARASGTRGGTPDTGARARRREHRQGLPIAVPH